MDDSGMGEKNDRREREMREGRGFETKGRQFKLVEC